MPLLRRSATGLQPAKSAARVKLLSEIYNIVWACRAITLVRPVGPCLGRAPETQGPWPSSQGLFFWRRAGRFWRILCGLPVIGGNRGAIRQMIAIRYFAPHPALRQHVSSYYWFESGLPAFADLMRAELGQIRLVVDGAAVHHYGDGRERPGRRAVLQGPTQAPVHYRAHGRLALFGIGLLPRGWAELVGVPAAELADDAVDLAAVMAPAAVADLLDAVAVAAGDAARCDVVDRFLLRRLGDARDTHRWFTGLADTWLTGSTNPDVDWLVGASGMSARSVERLCQRVYGAPPKLLARKYRALGAAVRLATGEASGWADAAGDAFYDQAHFIREFRAFTGLTPARFQVEAAPVTRLTIARRRQLPGLPRLALIA